MPRDRRAEDRDEYIIADHGRRIGRLEKRPIGGTFDQNEDPVIIGLGATAGGGSTPSNVSAGFAGAVAVGPSAEVDALHGVAIGYTPIAEDADDIAVGTNASTHGTGSAKISIGYHASTQATRGISIGWNPLAQGVSTISIGEQATSQGARQVSIGQFAGGGGVCDDGTSVGANSVVDFGSTGASSFGANSGARRDGATALGYNSNVTHTHSTGLGADSSPTENYQVMLGSDQDFVEIPGDSSGTPNGLVLTDTDGSGNRWIIQATSGALALSAAP